MIIETVLFPMHISQSHETLLSIADLCRVENKHLSVLLFGETVPPPLITYGDTTGAEIWAQQMIDNEQVLNSATSTLEDQLQKNNLLFDVRSVVGDSIQVDKIVGAHAAYADIVLVQRPKLNDSLNSFARRLYHGALFDSGKPLLIFDNALPASLHFETVLIAWDGKQSANRAVVESLSLLKKANKVHVLSIDSDKQFVSGSDEVDWELSTYLSRHQINVTVESQESMGKNVSALLTNRALELGANLLVCGSYGRSPLRERIFGGTTGELLEKFPAPIFLMH